MRTIIQLSMKQKAKLHQSEFINPYYKFAVSSDLGNGIKQCQIHKAVFISCCEG